MLSGQTPSLQWHRFQQDGLQETQTNTVYARPGLQSPRVPQVRSPCESLPCSCPLWLCKNTSPAVVQQIPAAAQRMQLNAREKVPSTLGKHQNQHIMNSSRVWGGRWSKKKLDGFLRSVYYIFMQRSTFSVGFCREILWCGSLLAVGNLGWEGN